MDHTVWVYGALVLLFTISGGLIVRLGALQNKVTRLENKADEWSEVKSELVKINNKLDMFLKQEIDTLKEIANSVKR